jgi:small subunit ribosomal protein S18
MQQQNNRNNNFGRAPHPMQMGGSNPFGQRNNQRRVEKKRKNPFGDASLKTIDYLDGKALLRFTNAQGKILPKRINGTTAYQQRQITKAVKYARHLALIPFVAQDLS